MKAALLKFHAWVNQMWGKTSTIVLALCVALMASPVPPPEYVRPYIFWVAVAAGFLRATAPKPPETT